MKRFQQLWIEIADRLSFALPPLAPKVLVLARAFEKANLNYFGKMAKTTEKPRELIVMLCDHLKQLKGRGPRAGGISKPFTTDSYVSLEDATLMFCCAVSQRYGEEPTRRWSDFLPELLLCHPERCEEVLGLIEREQFESPRYFELAGSSR